MKALEVKDFCKHFGGVQAVYNVSLSVRTGERHAIIGPNGAGKSTLLGMIGGQIHRDTGELYIFGQKVTNEQDYRRIKLGVSRTFQIMRLFFNLTVNENILLAIQAIKPYRFNLFRARNAYQDILEDAEILLKNWGLWEKRNMFIRELSYGEQRKVELIMGLSTKPRLMLLDEPTSGLSSNEINSFVDLILQIGKEVSLLIVEHDMDVVFNIATHITVLHYGKVVAVGDPKEIRNNPKAQEIYLGNLG